MKLRMLCAVASAALAAMAQTGVPMPQAGNVSLPVDEYNLLKDLAANPPKKAEEAPLVYIVQNADCKLRVTEQTVTGTVQLDGVVLQKGPVKVALVRAMTVLGAHLGGKPVPLVQESGTHFAILDGAGEFSLTLDVALPLTAEPGRASFSLPAPVAGAVRLNLVVSGEHTDISLDQGLITARVFTGGHTAIDATLVPGQISFFWWAVRTAAAPPALPKDLRFLSDVKTLVTVNDGEITLASLIDITVMQGEAERFQLNAPAGYEITGADGPTLQKSEARPGGVTLTVNSAVRSHQFLVSMSKTEVKSDSTAKLDVMLPGVQDSQRETGEALVEGVGTLQLTAAPGGGLRRSDVKEASAPLRSLAIHPAYAAFRYQKKPAEIPQLTLEWTRFPDATELSAVAQRAEVTTLVTSEGRSLTEVKLTLKNQSQPFVKVDLPAGASIVSAEVAGEKVKPVEGADGSRVPLLRPGFRPNGAYTVSFVFLHSGAPFSKKGVGELALPKMDMPVGVVQWEVYLPKQFAVATFGGDAIPAGLMPASSDLAEFAELRPGTTRQFAPPQRAGMALDAMSGDDRSADTAAAFVSAELEGRVVDPAGHPVRGATVTAINLSKGLTRSLGVDGNGIWSLYGLPSERTQITISAPGFQPQTMAVDLGSIQYPGLDTTLKVAPGNQTGDALVVGGSVSNALGSGGGFGNGRFGGIGGGGPGGAVLSTHAAETGGKTLFDNSDLSYESLGQSKARQQAAPNNPSGSQNVLDLQRRVAGVLPISVSVPHAGNSYRFVRPLVIAEETRVTFNYRIVK